MKELIDGGILYIATSAIISVKKGKDQRYAWNDEQRVAFIKEMARRRQRKKASTQRYKGWEK